MTGPSGQPISRRTAIAGAVGAALAACSSTSEVGDGASSSGSPTTTSAGTGAGSSASSKSSAPEATDAVPAVEPVASPGYDGPFPFGLGVASGDPDPTSVVLWTRLVLDRSASALDVALDVATDDTFDQLVASELVTATAEHAHSLHVIADELDSDTWYHYRFRIGEHVSTTGRARTTPPPGATTPLRVGASSCQNWETGGYAAHQHLAESDLDLFVWLGDYIYEYGPNDRGVVTTAGPRVHDGGEATDLDAYRARYAQYKRDPALRAHHAAHPWIVTWDDHEIDNNHAGLVAEDDQTPAEFGERRRAAHQAWWEHMPVRLDPPSGDEFRIHRSIEWGDIAAIHLLDGRQYRDPQPTDGEPVELPGAESFGVQTLGPTALDPAHTMLGTAQESWLIDAVSTSPARWQVLGNQVYMHGINAFPGDLPAINPDSWDGYHGSRRSLLEALAGAGAENLIVLTGDFHAASVGHVKPDPFDPASPVVATEFMAPAISSTFPEALRAIAPLALIVNPQVRHFDPDNGYLVCDVDRATWTAAFHVLDDVTDEASAASIAATFVVRNGTPGVT